MRSRLHRRYAFQDSDEVFEQLAVVRTTMERAQRFTAVSGRGMALVGATALMASLLSLRVQRADTWIALWLAECVLALGISLVTMARRCGGWEPLWHSPSSKRCALVLLPTAVSGLATTVLAVRQHWIALHEPVPAWLPGLWLMFYGAAVFSGGTVSLHEVRRLGALLFVAGVVSAAFSLPAWASMALGFGVLHIIFGVVIWRKYEA